MQRVSRHATNAINYANSANQLSANPSVSNYNMAQSQKELGYAMKELGNEMSTLSRDVASLKSQVTDNTQTLNSMDNLMWRIYRRVENAGWYQ